MFKDYSYKKVLSKGKQKIDGKKYDVQKDVYATVKKGQEPKISVKNDYVLVKKRNKQAISKTLSNILPCSASSYYRFMLST